MNADAENRGRRLGRLAGLFYLLLILVAVPGMVPLMGLIDRSDAAATAANLLASQDLVRLAFAGYLASTAGYVIVMGLFYRLFHPVNRDVALIALLLSLVGCAIHALGMLFVQGALLTLSGGTVGVGAPAGAPSALLFVELYIATYNIGLIFFGVQCILTGWLIYASRFLPRLLGAALMLGGAGYVTFLVPPFAASLFPFNVAPGYLTEVVLALWLLVRGVDAQRWAERALPSH